MKTFLPVLTGLVFALYCCCSVALGESDPPAEFTKEQLDFFEAKVRPLLKSECYHCHSARKQEGSLRLDARSLILEGGDSGPAMEPGDPAGSLIIEAVKREGF
ncbi:MAG: hypothetical protein KDA65_16615, partial [Planctomycetaceae bacterium]|nr:hypothetical protein [Planctomycetaceae bacterium]